MNAQSPRYRLAPGVLAQTALDEAVLLDARAGAYFGANASATLILRELLAGSDVDVIVQRVHQKFEQDAATIRADVIACLDDWLLRGLIVPTASDTR
jgi:hypothetical protein